MRPKLSIMGLGHRWGCQLLFFFFFVFFFLPGIANAWMLGWFKGTIGRIGTQLLWEASRIPRPS